MVGRKKLSDTLHKIWIICSFKKISANTKEVLFSKWSCAMLESRCCARAGFPKLLVDRYPLDTVAGLHVPPKFCDVSLKKKAFS